MWYELELSGSCVLVEATRPCASSWFAFYKCTYKFVCLLNILSTTKQCTSFVLFGFLLVNGCLNTRHILRIIHLYLITISMGFSQIFFADAPAWSSQQVGKFSVLVLLFHHLLNLQLLYLISKNYCKSCQYKCNIIKRAMVLNFTVVHVCLFSIPSQVRHQLDSTCWFSWICSDFVDRQMPLCDLPLYIQTENFLLMAALGVSGYLILIDILSFTFLLCI